MPKELINLVAELQKTTHRKII